MAVRTAAAQDLDSKIDALLTSLDVYLDLSGQTAEPANSPAEYFWATLISKLGGRQKMKPLIFYNKRDLRAYSVALLPTNSIESRDPHA
jgi:hypothetical protein